MSILLKFPEFSETPHGQRPSPSEISTSAKPNSHLSVSAPPCSPFQRWLQGTPAKRKILAILVVALGTSVGQAAIYDWDDGDRKLRLNIPDSVSTVRGLLIFGNGANGNSVSRATNSELVAIAESLDFAVLATGQWHNFFYSNNWELEYFESQIAQFAIDSSHPELVNAPWLPMGHSNGGQMSYGLNAKRPEKVIAFITSKGCCYNEFTPDEAALLTPGMLIAGETDTQLRRDNILSLFEINRPRGALWAWVEEEGKNHSEADAQQLKLAFLLECYRLRYPLDQSTLDGPIKLKNLNAYDGWLVDQTTWKNGLTEIHRQSYYDGEALDLGWVPNERIARIYQAFSSYNKASVIVSGSSGVLSSQGNVTYTVDLTGQDWEKIEFYEGADKMDEISYENENIVSTTYYADERRLYSNFAIVTLNDGTQRATLLRRVIVVGDPVVDPYTKWANTNLPVGQRDPEYTLHEDAITNLQRFAFGLGTGVTNRSQLPRITKIQGEPSQVFSFQVSPEAVDSGMLLTPQFSNDLSEWHDTSDEPLSKSYDTWRVHDTVYARPPENLNPETVFMRVALRQSE